jgi:hypothetical protein
MKKHLPRYPLACTAILKAILYGIPLCGWCPKGGWAEDYPSAPGLLRDYPELTETPSEGTRQRTEWNMRDADAILTIIPEGSQPSTGTDVGLVAGETLDKPMYQVMEDNYDTLDLDILFTKINNKDEGASENMMYMVACGRGAEELLQEIYNNYDGEAEYGCNH